MDLVLGKTTIIKALIDIYKIAGKKVVLCAPTGRAAKRMSESTGEEAKTIHRLLDIGKIEDDKLENIDYQDGQKVYHVATSEIQNPQEGDITVVPDTVEFTYTDIGNPMDGWYYLYKEFDKIWLTVTSAYNGNSTLNNTGRVNFYFNGEDSIVVAYAETDSNNNVVLYLPDGTPVPNNELYLENIDSAYTLNVNSQGQTGLGQYITAKLVDKGGVKEYINGEWVDRASSGGGGSADNAVLYVNQTLTDNQKTQARTNINAQEKIDSNHKLDYGLLSNTPNSLVCTYMDFFDPAFTPGPDNPKEGDTVVSGEATNSEIYDSPLPHTYFAQNTAVIRVSLRSGKTINTCSASKSDGTSEVLTQSDLPKTFAPGEISAVTCDPGNAILVEQTVFTYHEYRGGRWVARKDVPYDAVKYTTQSLSTSQKAQARTNIGAGTYSKPNTGIPASDLADGIIPTQTELTTSVIDTLWEAAS